MEWELTAVTRPAIATEIARKGPEGRIAYTSWTIAPRFPFRTVAGGCGLAPGRTTVKVTYRLPVWRPSGPPSEAVKAWMAREIPAVLEHEGGHRDLAVEGGNAVQAALSALSPEPTCPTLEARARAEAMRHIEHARQLEREYDAREYEAHRRGERGGDELEPRE